MTQRPLLYFAVVLLWSSLSGSAVAAGPKDLPKPTDYVSDFAHVLSSHAVVEIDRSCAQLDHSKADTQIAVVTIPSLDGADLAAYARELANIWGVGRTQSNRGVLVLLAINDHKWRIEVGRGLESILTNAKAEDIGKTMIPRLRSKDFDEAVRLAVHQIAQAASVEADNHSRSVSGK